MGKIPNKGAHSRKHDKNKFKNIDKNSNIFVTSPFKESSNNDINSNSKCDFDSETNDKYLEFFRKFDDLKKENSELSLNYENFEKRINVLKQNLEESEKNLKDNFISNLEFDQCISKMQKLLMTSDDTIEELESEIVTIKSERDNLSEKLACVQNKLSLSEKSNFELEKKVVTLNKEISLLKQKLDNSDSKPSKDEKNDDKINFTSFITSFKDNCEIFADKFDFDFTDDKLTFDFEGGSEINYDEKLRELLNDYVLKRKENSNFYEKINDLENEVKFLKSCLGESEKKLEMQQFDFEDKLQNSQNICLSFEKNLELQRSDFLEKLKSSQCKFLACDKARKDLEKKMNVLTSELENYKTISHQFTNGSQGLDKLLSMGKSSQDRSGLGFEKASNVPCTSQTTFVRSTSKVETSNSQGKVSPKGQKFQNPRPSIHERNKNKCASSRTSSKKFIPICHHCGIVGHIRPKCFKLLNDQSYVQLGAYNRFHVSNSSFQKPSPNVFEKEKAKFYKNRISHQRFVPKCHHCGEIGHIRPKCQRFLKGKSSLDFNIFKKFDEIANEISKLRNGMNRKSTFDSVNSRNPGKKIWIKKGESNIFPTTKVFDILKKSIGLCSLD